MRRIKIALAGIVLGIAANSFAVTTHINSPIGYWKTLDEVTGKPKSIVQIWQAENNVLMGKIVKVFPADKNKRASSTVGTVILSGLKSYENHWGNGKLIDLQNGKTYSVNLRTAENGQRLNVQNYTGIPLLGRSQTWERVDLMSGK